MSEPLFMWAIFEKPADYPAHFVVRQWLCADGNATPCDELHALSATLEEARKSIPVGRFRLPRSEGDVPSLVEVWV